MASGDAEESEGLLASYDSDVEGVAQQLALGDRAKAREKLSDLLSKLAAAGAGAVAGPLAGVGASIAVKVVMAKFEKWLENNSATANFMKAVAETQGDADRRLLVRDIRRWLSPTLSSITDKLARQGEVHAANAEVLEQILEELSQPQADSLIGILRTRYLALPTTPTHAQLLDARYGVVPFDEASRQTELDALRALCSDDALGNVELQLFVSAGGAGKSRLLMHFCEELWSRSDEHWHAGFLNEEIQDEALRALARPGYPALVVIDYAEGRRDLSGWLKRLIESDRVRSKLRIVLLARNAGDWWASLARGDAAVAHLLRRRAMRLRDVAHEQGDRGRLYANARAAYAAKLALPGRSVGPGELDEPQFARPLFLSMAALLDILGDTQQRVAKDLPWQLVQREATFWTPATTNHWPAMRWMAAITLRGGIELNELKRLATTADFEFDETTARRIAHYYPRERGIGGLEPDLLGEALVFHALKEAFTDEDFVIHVMTDAPPGQVQQALTVLARIAADHPKEAGAWIARLLESDPQRHARPAFDAALAMAEQRVDPVLGKALADALKNVDDVSLAREIEGKLPDHTVSLRELRVWVCERLLSVATTDRERARRWVHLGAAYSYIARRAEALEMTSAGAQVYRALAADDPAVFLPHLAWSLNSLGNMHSALGEDVAALQHTTEAVDLYRSLSEKDPQFLFRLAGSLRNLGIRFGSVGDREGALKTTSEALDEYRRQLAHNDTDAFLFEFAEVLGNFAGCLIDKGDHEGALGATREAVAILRTLAERNPDAFLPALARNLSNLAVALGHVDKRQEALAVALEALQIHRLLAENSESFMEVLGNSFNNVGKCLHRVGDLDGAVTATQEAILIRRRLAKQFPGAFLQDLASSLGNLAFLRKTAGERKEALDLISEAILIQTALVKQRPRLQSALDKNLQLLMHILAEHDE